MKTIIIFAVIVGGILAWFFISRSSAPEEGDIVAKNGLHWHTQLEISILGQKQAIPAGLGLAAIHLPMHTHETDNMIHLEFAGKVSKDDIRLGKFFKIWGKTFNKDCIFDKCRGPEGELKILVDGKENGEYDNYVMEDSDKIEIIFE